MAAANERVGIAEAAFYSVDQIAGSAGFSSLNHHVVCFRKYDLGRPAHRSTFLNNGGKLKAEEKPLKAEYEKHLPNTQRRISSPSAKFETSLTDVECAVNN